MFMGYYIPIYFVIKYNACYICYKFLLFSCKLRWWLAFGHCVTFFYYYFHEQNFLVFITWEIELIGYDVSERDILSIVF